MIQIRRQHVHKGDDGALFGMVLGADDQEGEEGDNS